MEEISKEFISVEENSKNEIINPLLQKLAENEKYYSSIDIRLY